MRNSKLTKEQIKKQNDRYYAENSERIKEYKRRKYHASKEKVKQERKDYYEKNKKKIIRRVSEYRRKNKEIINQRCSKRLKEYREENKEKIRSYRRKYDKTINGKAKRRAGAMKRYTIKKKASPPWLTKDHYKEIEQFYIEARRLELEDGVKRQVDHIVPLQGKTVCGLHVPWNLQVLTYDENIRKSNNLTC